jgi:hypothetical protein
MTAVIQLKQEFVRLGFNERYPHLTIFPILQRYGEPSIRRTVSRFFTSESDDRRCQDKGRSHRCSFKANEE